MPVKFNRYNPLRLLNSVPFGITLMALIALYLAAGSGRQWLRSTGVDDLPVIRDWFDKTDLQFNDSWPLKTLMALLVANLVVVTWRKIPLTPPRYGVWCVHAGIITLVLGSATYYSQKLEGRVRLYTDPAAGPSSVTQYYDKDERALYVRTGQDLPAAFPLPTLPRFQQYDAADGTASGLARRGLTDLRPTLTVADRDGLPVQESVAEEVGVRGDLRVDVVGFYPYANIHTSFDTSDPASHVTGVELSMGDPQDPQSVSDWYVVASDPRFRSDSDHLMEVQHRDVDAAEADKVAEAAGQLFRLDVLLAGHPDATSTLYVQPGQNYPLGKSGYSLAVEGYNPAFPLFGTNETAPALTLMVTTPTQKFRRMVLNGKPGPSDFRLAAPGVPPMKMRSAKPLDPALQVAFALQDPYQLLPQDKQVRHTLMTPSGSKALIDVQVQATGTAAVHRFPSGSGDVLLAAPSQDEGGDASAMGTSDHPAIRVHLERHDHLDPQDSVVPVPPRQREEQADEDGLFQAVKLRVRLGSWSHEIVVPYTVSAADHLRQDPWRGGFVTLPGALAPLQFQLGNTRRPLPATLTLDQFKVVPFPGGQDTPEAFIQDYRSTVTMSGNDDSDSITEVASLNHPIYFNHGRWLFFQAAYDPNVPHTWTQLGIGNRPAVWVMESGCILIVIGLLYAFYLKPVIVRRMKDRALAAAVAAGRGPRARLAVVEEPAELVNT